MLGNIVDLIANGVDLGEPALSWFGISDFQEIVEGSHKRISRIL